MSTDKNKPVWLYPLEGMHLIEASAGTGKTYAIMNLYLRFLLEMQCPVEDILVVTFTEAATKELKDRIRRNVMETIEWFDGLDHTSDEAFRTVIESSSSVNQIITARHCLALCEGTTEGEREDILKKVRLILRRAVVSFDEASIFTIHGFCQRMLNENAFESGVLFDTELLTDDSALIKGVVEDFWREQLYAESDVHLNCLKESKVDIERLIKIAKEFLKNPGLELAMLAEAKYDQAVTAGEALRKVQAELKGEVAQFIEKLTSGNLRQELEETLCTPKLLNGPYKTTAKLKLIVDEFVAEMKDFPFIKDWKKVEVFTMQKILENRSKAAIKAKSEVKKHLFFDFCERCVEVAKALAQTSAQKVIKQFVTELREKVAAHKRLSNVQTYNDLLQNLQIALQGEQGGRYIKLIRTRFPVAMIDEFQDTDPVQYDIFSRIFGSDSNTSFYMIGDPKQSIYKFRGADIYSYLKAKSEIKDDEHIHGLGTNYRSETAMVDAVNHYFKSSDDPFVSDVIDFDDVNAAGKADQEAKLVTAGNQASLQFHWSSKSNYMTKPLALSEINNMVADEIVTLLNNPANHFQTKNTEDTVKKERVRAGDIAILVTEHSQAHQLQHILKQRGVPSVLQNSGNVFTSEEFTELRLLLRAIAEPREQYIRTALIGKLINLSHDELKNLSDNGLMGWYQYFVELRKLWIEKGYMSMIRHFMQMNVADSMPHSGRKLANGTGLQGRLVSCQGGERVVTNLLHLSELIHHQEERETLPPEGVLSWLDQMVQNLDSSNEEHLQRLESDENAVKFLTVHKSKGLEFPIVFCPFMWRKTFKPRLGDFLYTENEEQYIDIGSEEKNEHKEIYKKETLQESLRLLYVALTRSRNRCYIHWGPVNGSECSALMYMAAEHSSVDHFLSSQGEDFKFGAKNKNMPETVFGKLKDMAENIDGMISVESRTSSEGQSFFIPWEAKKMPTESEEFAAKIPYGRGVCSFSSITRNAHGSFKSVENNTAKKCDATEEQIEESYGQIRNFIDIPGGAGLGTAVHEIFEEIDYRSPEDGLEGLIENKLTIYGLIWGASEDERHTDCERKVDAIRRMVLNTLKAKITIAGEVVQLSQVDLKDRLVEMKFFYRLEQLSSADLASVFYGEEHDSVPAGFSKEVSKLKNSVRRGFLNGAIDLTFKQHDKFYVLDWKTTSCGKKVADYTPQNMTLNMASHFYILQYHIYVVAVHLYLKQRIPDYDYENQFGGVIYDYLRGVNAKFPENGFHCARPTLAVVEDLCNKLVGDNK